MRDADNRDVIETDELQIVDLNDPVEAGKRQIGGPGRGQRLNRRTRMGLGVVSLVGVVVLLFVVVFSTRAGSLGQGNGQVVVTPTATMPINLTGPVVWRPAGQEIIASRQSQGGFVNGGRMDVFQKSSGHLLWKSDAYVNLFSNQTFVRNDVLYIELWTGAIQAVHLSTGKVIWQSVLKEGQLQALDQGIIYALGEDSTIYASRVTDGKLVWKQTSSMVESVMGQQKVVMAGGGIVVVSATDGSEVDAWRASDGKYLWTYKNNGGGWVEAIQNGVVYMISQKQTVDAIRAEDGTALWSYAVQDINPVSTTIIKITPTLIALATTNGRMGVSVLRISDGTKLWNDDSVLGVYSAQNNGFFSPPVDLLYRYDSNQKVMQVLKWEDGSILWAYKTDAQPIYAIKENNTIYVESVAYGVKTVVALHRDTGVAFWSYKEPLGGYLIGIDTNILFLLLPQSQSIELVRLSDHKVLWQQHL